jgi:hypothetical protein
VWISLNGTRNGETTRIQHSVAPKIKTYAEMIELHLFKPDTSNRRDTYSSVPCLSPQLEGTVIIKFDATIFSSPHQMGVNIMV